MKRTNEPIYAGGISIKPHYAFSYVYRLDNNFKRSTLPRTHLHLTELSKKARIRITTAMQWLIHLSPMNKTWCQVEKRFFRFRLNFITLTLSEAQQHDDNYITHKLLMPFLKWLKRKGVDMYIWKAEVQDNGNIHYHITTHKYVHWRSVRNKWNNLQHNHGYLKKYFDEHGTHDPNSTDIHAVKNDKQIISYMVKYMTKADRYKKNQQHQCINESHYYHSKNNEVDEHGKKLKRYVESALWSCSQSLSNMRMIITEEDYGYKTMDLMIRKYSNTTQLKHGELHLYRNKASFADIRKTRAKLLNYSNN